MDSKIGRGTSRMHQKPTMNRSAAGSLKSVLIIAMAFVVFTLAACGSSKSTISSARTRVSTTRPQKLMSVNVGVYPGVIFSLMVQVALHQGLFQQNGLSPNFIYINGGPEIDAALESGSIDFGENSYDNLLIGKQDGLNMKAVVGNVSVMPFSIVVRSGVPTPNIGQPYPAPVKDLRGLRLGVPALNTSVEYFFKEMLANAGVPASSVTFIAVTPPSAIAALQAKQIDAYLAFEPIQSIATASHIGKILLDLRTGAGPANFRDIPYNSWWATDSYISSHPAQVRAFQKTMIAADKFIHDPSNFAKVLAVAKQVLPTKPLTNAQFEAMVKSNLRTLGSAIPARTIPAWDRLLLKAGLLKESIPASNVILSTAPK